jgi:hypothetical protein
MPINYRNKAYFTAGAGIDETFLADADLSSCQYRFVTVGTTAGTVVGANGASNPTPIGVLQNSPASGGVARVRVFGTTCVVAVTPSGCGLAYGRYFTASTVGQAVPSASETGGIALGRWLDTGLAVSLSTIGKAFVNCAGFATCLVAAS